MNTNKSFSTETSERYARALFEISKDSDEIKKIESDVKAFKLITDTNSEFNNFIKDPTKNNRTQIEVINILATKLNFSKNFKNFLLLLIKKRRIFFAKKIFDSFLRLCTQKRGEIKASLISSKRLSDLEIKRISDDLSKEMGSTLQFDYEVDETLIGGLKIQLGSYMIDTSIKSKLKKFEHAMLKD